MLRHLRDPKEARETMLTLLQTAGTLAGIGIGLVLLDVTTLISGNVIETLHRSEGSERSLA